MEKAPYQLKSRGCDGRVSHERLKDRELDERKPDIILTNATDNGRRNPAANIEITVTKPIGLLELLLSELTGRSRNNIKSLLTNREISVDGHIVTQYDYPLSKGQIVRIVRSVKRGEKPKDLLRILYEDKELIVVNKPAGLLSVSTDRENEKTVYHLLADYMRRSTPKGRPFVVHRLDRDTSGVLLFAKNERMQKALQDNWDSLVLQRCYAAAVEGHLKEKSGRIHSWLRQTSTLLVYSAKNAGDGLEAITTYQVIEENANYSLINIQLETGRKNQIRVHMKEMGNPVVGDKKYGAKTDPLKRLGLHAYKLELIHPFSDKRMCFEAEVPDDLKALFKR
ncbi:MAG: RluA family pseudouridine synthase [Oscillospiraceae bacterium]|nr:RluA family pseudouridine synthase [Oscillospiraceae bacterium]